MSKKITSVEKEKLYNSFLSRFPLDSLQNMTLEQYTGTGDSRDDFCYWVKYKVDKVGGMGGGSSDVFGIYKYINPSKKPKMISDSQYSWLKELGSDANAAWEKIRGLICSIAKSANEEKYGDIDSIQCIGNNFKWKVAFLYSNKRIPPIYSEKAVKLLAKKHNINIANSEPQSNIEPKLMSLKGDMDFWEFADMLWDDYKKSDDWFLETIASIAESLQEKMVSEKFLYAYNKDDIFAGNKKDFFIWVQTGDGRIIGNEKCHYEFYFDKEEKKMFPMIHFENDFRKDSDILKIFNYISNHTQFKKFAKRRKDWFYIEDSEMDIGEYEKDSESFCDTAINWMRKLDNMVGDERKREINRMSSKDNLELYVNKLRNVKNLILTGAPGTGKTYLAKQIASYIVSNGNLCDFRETKSNDIYKDRIKVVQFHPSYDYADFIEGLRPVKNGGQISFERQDGVLKSFCKLALNDFDHAYERFYGDLMGGKLKNVEFHSASEGSPFHIEVSNAENNSIRVNKPGDEIFLTKENIINYERDGQSDSNTQIIATYAPDIIKYIKDHYSCFVLIIDEINRGEVSKIFGELFNAIDIGYRGKGDPIDTQFQNMLREEEKEKEDKDPFYDGFYVPDNVYIIGTMNDIDRSVESMDFAFRRRFAWVEIKANERQQMLEELPEDIAKKAKPRMISLNNAIWKKDADDSEKIEGMSSAYHIGASYFLNLNNYIDEDDPFEALWEYHLEPLLREYLRGIDDSDATIDMLHKSYKNPVASNDS